MKRRSIVALCLVAVLAAAVAAATSGATKKATANSIQRPALSMSALHPRPHQIDQHL